MKHLRHELDSLFTYNICQSTVNDMSVLARTGLVPQDRQACCTIRVHMLHRYAADLTAMRAVGTWLKLQHVH